MAVMIVTEILAYHSISDWITTVPKCKDHGGQCGPRLTVNTSHSVQATLRSTSKMLRKIITFAENYYPVK